MTKRELISALSEVPDDAVVEIVIRAGLRTLDLRVVGLLKKISYNPATSELHRGKKGHKQNVGRVLIHGEFVES